MTNGMIVILFAYVAWKCCLLSTDIYRFLFYSVHWTLHMHNVTAKKELNEVVWNPAVINNHSSWYNNLHWILCAPIYKTVITSDKTWNTPNSFVLALCKVVLAIMTYWLYINSHCEETYVDKKTDTLPAIVWTVW